MYTNSKDVLASKSFSFSVDLIKLIRKIQLDSKEFIITKQILRSGTSIGASVREAKYAQSKLDFIHKLSISLKESNETIYWFQLLIASEIGPISQLKLLQSVCEEIKAILIKSILTTKESIR